jgi:MFS family permease
MSLNDTASSQQGEMLLPPAMPTAAGFRRYVVVLLCFFGLMLLYMMRVDLSIAVLTMTPQFRWSGTTEGFVLSSFYIGYIVGQIPGGSIATRFGGNLMFGVGVLATGVFTLVLPFTTCGTLECPAYTASAIGSSSSNSTRSGGGGDGGTNATCGFGTSNLMATFSGGNLTLADCYTACLGTCFQHGNVSDVCGALGPKFKPQACVANCTAESYCSVFAFGNSSTASSANSSNCSAPPPASQPTCVLYHACQPTATTTTTAYSSVVAAGGREAVDSTTSAMMSGASSGGGGSSGGGENGSSSNSSSGDDLMPLFDVQTTSYLWALYALRILMGLFESITFPSFFALLSRWTPSSERRRVDASVRAGAGPTPQPDDARIATAVIAFTIAAVR